MHYLKYQNQLNDSHQLILNPSDLPTQDLHESLEWLIEHTLQIQYLFHQNRLRTLMHHQLNLHKAHSRHLYFQYLTPDT